jgi:hypothetical protein
MGVGMRVIQSGIWREKQWCTPVKTLYTLLQSTRLESQLANEDMESTIHLSETVSTVYNFREKRQCTISVKKGGPKASTTGTP